MSRIKSPCLDCKNRIVTDDINCHSVCEEYLAFRANLDEINSRQFEESKITQYEVDSARRVKRQYRK